MDFVCRIIERGDIGRGRWLLPGIQDSEFGMVQDLARVVDRGKPNFSGGGRHSILGPRVLLRK